MPKDRAHQTTLRWLTPREQDTFRKDFQDKEREIQRNIGIYLSGLVLVTGWIIGPQSRPMIAMALGNQGYNIYALLLLVVLNVIFLNFLIYKSIIVHEITQFISYLSEPTSGFNYWESWRRSPQSATKPVRKIYTVSLSLLPVLISFLVMFIVGRLIYSDPTATASALKTYDPTVIAATPEHFAAVFRFAKVAFLLVLASHFIPFYFFYHNVWPTNRRWDKLKELRSVEEAFAQLDLPSPLSGARVRDELPRSIQLLNKETGTVIGELTVEQLDFLMRNLLRENDTDDDFYLSAPTLDVLKESGADTELIGLLSRAIGEQEGVEVKISSGPSRSSPD